MLFANLMPTKEFFAVVFLLVLVYRSNGQDMQPVNKNASDGVKKTLNFFISNKRKEHFIGPAELQ